MSTLKELLRKGTLVMEAGPRKKESGSEFEPKWEHWATRCRFTYKGQKTMSLVYRQGLGHHDQPTRAEVIESVLDDCASIDAYDGMKYAMGAWADDLGFDSVERAEKTWNACVEQRKSLKNMLGNDYAMWVEALILERNE